MKFKSGVKIFGLRPEIVAVLPVIDGIWTSFSGYQATITSASEPYTKHKRGSIHYSGGAVDVRIRFDDEPGIYWRKSRPQVLDTILKVLREDLTNEFDVIEEKDHIHVEFQPKGHKI